MIQSSFNANLLCLCPRMKDLIEPTKLSNETFEVSLDGAPHHFDGIQKRTLAAAVGPDQNVYWPKFNIYIQQTAKARYLESLQRSNDSGLLFFTYHA